MCVSANSSNRYTNHCTRVTSAVMLNEAGFNENDICKVTGHASTSSLKSYNHRATTAKKRQMSDAINREMYAKKNKNDKENTAPVVQNVPLIECNQLDELNDEQMCSYVESFENKLSSNDTVQGIFSNLNNVTFTNCSFNINVKK